MHLPPASLTWRRESNLVFDEEVAFQPRFCDPDTGLPLYRLTGEPVVSSNIYPEVPVSTPDGRFFIFSRRAALSDQVNYWIADTQRFFIRQVTDEANATEPVLHPTGDKFLYRRGQEIWSLKIPDFTREIVLVLPDEVEPVSGLRSFDASGRYAVLAARSKKKPVGVAVVDFDSARVEFVYDHPKALNPHPQLSRHPSTMVLVQVNNGIKFDEHGNLLALVGENGASLVVCDLNGSHPTLLNVGFSPVERVQGHQCWLGSENKVLTTLHRRADLSSPWVQDRVALIAPGDETYRIVGEGPGFTHIHADPGGEFWISDCNRSGDIFIGSIKTGRFRLVCHSSASFGSPQETHPHPFFIGNRNKVGWNSDTTGVPQIYFTEIPDEFFRNLSN
jgi:hypothetical protein